MHRVLIVEDEMLVRVGLKNSIPWEDYGMRVIADSANGQTGWEAYLEEKPDLVITDIRMPIMDGMQLISKIRENDSDTKIIILTCLEEFELAKKALSYGVSDYILKLTMTQEEILSVLSKVKLDLDKSQKTTSDFNTRESLNIWKEKIIQDFIFYNFREDELEKCIKQYNLRLSPERLVVCVMEIDHFEKLQKRFKDNHGNLIRFSLLNMIEEILDEYQRGEACHEKDGRYLILFSFHDVNSENEIWQICSNILERINKVLKRYLNISVTFGKSGIEQGYSKLRSLFFDASSILTLKFILGLGQIYGQREHNVKSVIESCLQTLHQYVRLSGLSSNCREEMTKVIDDTMGFSKWTEDDLKKMFLRLIHVPGSLDDLRYDFSSLSWEYSNIIQKCETMDEMLDQYKRFLYKMNALRDQTHPLLSKGVADALHFISERYPQEITISHAADFVCLTPNYLSYLFKKELKINFSDFLSQYRINKAKELLLQTHLKSYEVAEKVGFNDDSYFSRTFKKWTGLRPNDFRKQRISAELGSDL